MYYASVVLLGASPISMSRNTEHVVPKLEKESADDYDARIWRDKAYANAKGEVFIQGMALKQSLDAAAKYSGEKIAGKGQKTWGPKFTSGVLVTEQPLLLDAAGKPVMKSELAMEMIHANADGVRGSGKRVWRRFPMSPADWSINVTVTVVDDEITPERLKKTLQDAGLFIGIGRFRPQKGGYLGRFTVEKFTTKEV